MNWIIDKKQDLLWFIGSISISYIFLSVYYGLNYFANASLAFSSLVIYLIWTVIFDATHIFATYTRTYFDKDFRQRNARLIYGGLALLLIGPLYMLLFYTIGTKEQYRAAFLIFNRFGVLYAYYHLIRQHWGFIALYNRKNPNISAIQTKLESVILWTGTLYPLIYHNIHYYIPFGLAEKKVDIINFQDWLFVNTTFIEIAITLWITRLIIGKNLFGAVLSIIYGILVAVFLAVSIVLYFGLTDCLRTLLLLSGYTFILASLIYTSYLFYKKNEIKDSLPKLSLLFLVVFTNNFILSLDMPYITAYACITVFHNIQYHAIVRFHNKNKYLMNEEKFGLASIMTKNIILFVIMALSFNLIFTLPRTVIEYISTSEIFIYFAASFFWGIGFHHYVFDAIIWRPSRDNEVSTNLKLKYT